MIGSLSVPKGDYTLFVNLANPAAWELIVNKQTGQSGLEYDGKQDLGRVKMTMSKPPRSSSSSSSRSPPPATQAR